MTTSTTIARPSLRHIRAAAARMHGLDGDTLSAPGHGPPHLHARQLAAAVARRLGYSLPHIGRALGRDHSTILHGLRRFDERCRDAPELHARCGLALDLARRIAAGARLPPIPRPEAPPARSRRAPRALPAAPRTGPVLICRDGAWRLEVRT